MTMKRLLCLISLLSLTACDKITGVEAQKIADAEAIGFACRVAEKQPEVCMKENEAQSPSSVLDGWKSADEDIKAGKLDPKMTAHPKKEGESTPKDSGNKEGGAKEGEKPAEADAAPADGDKTDKKDEKPSGDSPAADKKTDKKMEKPASKEQVKDSKPTDAKNKEKH